MVSNAWCGCACVRACVRVRACACVCVRWGLRVCVFAYVRESAGGSAEPNGSDFMCAAGGMVLFSGGHLGPDAQRGLDHLRLASDCHVPGNAAPREPSHAWRAHVRGRGTRALGCAGCEAVCLRLSDQMSRTGGRRRRSTTFSKPRESRAASGSRTSSTSPSATCK